MSEAPARQRSWGWAFVLVCALAGLVACVGAAGPGSELPSDAGASAAAALDAYVRDPGVGRRALEASLVRQDNGYARLRLERYAEARWGALPTWNPPATPIHLGDLGTRGPLDPEAARPLEASLVAAVEAGQTLPLQAWVDLGRRAFHEYPIQPAGYWMNALGDRETATRFGAYVLDDRVGSLVWTQMPGPVRRFEPAYTCATCHASTEGTQLVAGRNNADLDVAGVVALGGAAPLGWRPGTLDVTADASDNPVAIADLRPVRLQNRLHHAGTLRNDLIPLAVRIETLIVTSMNETVRPPRVLVAALAAYLWSLASTARPGRDLARDPKGRALFEQHCGRCHHEDGTSGDPVALGAVGTDPRVGVSAERGTGTYRVPSLAFVGDRRRLLASGAIDDLPHLLEPQRLDPTNPRHVPGHAYGLELEPAERSLLLAFLRAL